MKTKKDKKQIYWYLLIILIFLAILFFFSRNRQQQQSPNNSVANRAQMNRNNCLSDDCLLVNDLEYPVGELTPEVKDALNRAIEDEYKAMSTYQKVIGKFGMIRPFSMIENAEEQHIASLKGIFDKYGITVPVNNWVNKITIPTTLTQACQAGVEAETANIKLYKEELLPLVKDYEDIIIIFTNLMEASEQKHLDAFQKCN